MILVDALGREAHQRDIGDHGSCPCPDSPRVDQHCHDRGHIDDRRHVRFALQPVRVLPTIELCGTTRAIPQAVTKVDGESMTVLVKQEDKTGCGLACIAMLAGKRYATIRARAMTIREDLCEGFGKRRNFKTRPSDLKKLAKEFELCLGRKVQFPDPKPMNIENFTRFMNDLELGCDAVLAINPNPRKNGEWHWHWVVWDCERGRVLDPKEPPYRRRIRPWYYLPVC